MHQYTSVSPTTMYNPNKSTRRWNSLLSYICCSYTCTGTYRWVTPSWFHMYFNNCCYFHLSLCRSINRRTFYTLHTHSTKLFCFILFVNHFSLSFSFSLICLHSISWAMCALQYGAHFSNTLATTIVSGFAARRHVYTLVGAILPITTTYLVTMMHLNRWSLSKD